MDPNNLVPLKPAFFKRCLLFIVYLVEEERKMNVFCNKLCKEYLLNNLLLLAKPVSVFGVKEEQNSVIIKNSDFELGCLDLNISSAPY